MRYVLPLLLLLSPGLRADDLCGGANQTVCLETIITLGLAGTGTLAPGTTVVFRIPGMESSGPGEIEGTPTKAYRFGAPATVIDGNGGVWSATPLAEDDLGTS